MTRRSVRPAALLSLAFCAACGTPASPASPAAPASQQDGGPSETSPDAALPILDASSAPGADGGGGALADAGVATADAGSGVSATLGFVSSAYTLYATVGGGTPHLVQLDTGSLGLYVPASILGPSATVSTTACSITYVSSGNTLSGFEATAPVALLGSTTKGDVSPPPTTVPMTFCAVSDTSFTGGVMGVGFGRGSGSDPTRNVLLEMADIKNGTMHAGYVLSTHPAPSVQIGLTAATSTGFQLVPLTADPSGNGDWVATSLRGCLTLPAVSAFTQECGGLLVDTGIPECLLWGPPDPTLGGAIPSGQTAVPSGVAIQIASAAGASTLAYSFVVGTGTDAPSAVDIRTASAFSINTGRALLVDNDYLFDAALGFVGFRTAK